MIREDIFNRSMETAQKVLDISVNLRGVGTRADYFERDGYLQDLLGEEGHVSFHPEVKANIIEPFKNLLIEGVRELQKKYYLADDETGVLRFRSHIADNLLSNVSTESLLNNEVPSSVLAFINSYAEWAGEEVVKESRQYKSPKLSKLIVKLWGEQHDIAKWYTTKCPRNLDKGVLNDWTVTLSILPHHIAGMSYYAPLNHGGQRWREGWNGTSCMDTKVNSRGTGVFQLIPSMRDVTMAVAYLSHADDNDIWNPIYQARCLVRVVYIEGKPHMIACRPYFINNEAKHILIDGLKNKFGNVHFVQDMREYKEDTDWVEFKAEFPDSILYEVDGEVRCEDCDGDGYTGYDDYGDQIDCMTCDGEGTWHVSGDYLPYIDDEDFIRVSRNSMTFMLPTAYLTSVGIELRRVEKEAVAPSIILDYLLRPA